MSFHGEEGIVLGHVISDKRIEIDKAKIDLIFNLPLSHMVKEIRSFSEHAGFYHKFIKNFSKISKPLCNLLTKDVAFVFNDERLKAFEQLKAMFDFYSYHSTTKLGRAF